MVVSLDDDLALIWHLNAVSLHFRICLGSVLGLMHPMKSQIYEMTNILQASSPAGHTVGEVGISLD